MPLQVGEQLLALENLPKVCSQYLIVESMPIFLFDINMKNTIQIKPKNVFCQVTGQQLVVLEPDLVVLALDLAVLVLDLVVLVLDPVVLVLDPVVFGLDQVAMGQGGLGLDPGLAVLDLDPLDKGDMGLGVLVLDHKVLQQAILALAWVQDQEVMVLVGPGLALEATLLVVVDTGNESHSNQVSFCDITHLFLFI